MTIKNQKVKTRLVPTGTVAKLAGVPIFRIHYALTVGKIPEPTMRVGGRRLFSIAEAEKIQNFFRASAK